MTDEEIRIELMRQAKLFASMRQFVKEKEVNASSEEGRFTSEWLQEMLKEAEDLGD